MSIASWLSSLISVLVLLDLTLMLLIAIIVAWLSQFMIIFLVLVPDSLNIFAAVPTAKVSAWKTVDHATLYFIDFAKNKNKQKTINKKNLHLLYISRIYVSIRYF